MSEHELALARQALRRLNLAAHEQMGLTLAQRRVRDELRHQIATMGHAHAPARADRTTLYVALGAGAALAAGFWWWRSRQPSATYLEQLDAVASLS